MACAPCEDSDQPGNLPSLIRVFAVRMKKAWVLSYPLNASEDFIQTLPRLIRVFTGRTCHFVGFDMRRLKFRCFSRVMSPSGIFLNAICQHCSSLCTLREISYNCHFRTNDTMRHFLKQHINFTRNWCLFLPMLDPSLSHFHIFAVCGLPTSLHAASEMKFYLQKLAKLLRISKHLASPDNYWGSEVWYLMNMSPNHHVK